MSKKDSFAMIAMIGQFYKEQLFHGRNYEVGKMLYCGIRVMQQTKPGDVLKGFCTNFQLIGKTFAPLCSCFEKFLHNFADILKSFLHNFAADLKRRHVAAAEQSQLSATVQLI